MALKKSMTITLRLGPAESAEIARACAVWGVPRSEAVRRLILGMALPVKAAGESSLHDRMKHVCGIVSSKGGLMRKGWKDEWARHLEKKHGLGRRTR